MKAARSVEPFMSHTRLDTEFCDRFDRAATRIGVKVFRSEFERLERPAWKTIGRAINRSSALFFLIGKELVESHESSVLSLTDRRNWQHTQNWISYEVGVACQRGIDVWVVTDGIGKANFPVPYLNNFVLSLEGSEHPTEISVILEIIRGMRWGSEARRHSLLPTYLILV